MIRHLTFLLLLLSGSIKSFAQDLNFTIHYPLEISGGSGNEKNQIAELDNDNMVLYRYAFDSTAMQHKLRYWCSDPMGTVLWNKEFLIGSGESVGVHGSICAHANSFFLAFTKVLGNGNSVANILKCDENGNVIESSELSIAGSVMMRQLNLILADNEIVLAGLIIDVSNSSVFVARSVSQSFESAEVFITDELEQLSTLYLGENNSLHLVGLKNFQATDITWNWNEESTGIVLPPNTIIREAIYENGDTYYVGFDVTDLNFPNAVLMKLDSNNDLEWFKQLQVSGPMFHGTTASDLCFYNGEIVIIGYGSVPHPITYITRFTPSGILIGTKHYDSFFSFNYNLGELFKHSNGHLYLSKLGGIYIDLQPVYVTSFLCLSTTLENDCDDEDYHYDYSLIAHVIGVDTVSWQQEGSFVLNSNEVNEGIMTDTMYCHSNLNLNEYNLLEPQLYPNPFTSTATLSLPEGCPALQTLVRCTDALGREISFDYAITSEYEISITFEPDIHGSVFFYLENGEKKGIIVGVK